jgi:hypothetical protein
MSRTGGAARPERSETWTGGDLRAGLAREILGIYQELRVRVQNVDGHLGLGTAGVWGKGRTLGVTAQERKQNPMLRSEGMVRWGQEIKAMTHSH